MWYIVISLIGLGVVAAIAGYFRNKKLQKMLERGEILGDPRGTGDSGGLLRTT